MPYIPMEAITKQSVVRMICWMFILLRFLIDKIMRTRKTKKANNPIIHITVNKTCKFSPRNLSIDESSSIFYCSNIHYNVSSSNFKLSMYAHTTNIMDHISHISSIHLNSNITYLASRITYLLPIITQKKALLTYVQQCSSWCFPQLHFLVIQV